MLTCPHSLYSLFPKNNFRKRISYNILIVSNKKDYIQNLKILPFKQNQFNNINLIMSAFSALSGHDVKEKLFNTSQKNRNIIMFHATIYAVYSTLAL